MTPGYEETVAALPMSFAQQRLWFLDQLEPGQPAYNLPLALRLSGALDTASLQRSLNELVRRHEVLRTTFATYDGQPVQVIAPALALELNIHDLSSIAPNERQAEARRRMAAEANRPFDLARGPLVRASLLKLEAMDHVLVLVMHHSITDGWSLGIIERELAQLYRAFHAGQPSPLPDLPLQYADFAVWQRDWLQGQELDKQLAYWKQQLAGSPPLLELPADRPRPAVHTCRGAARPFALSAELTHRLKSLCRQEGTTLFMTLLAAFQVLVHRYSGQTDLVIGAPVANRNGEEIENLIGLFVNTLAMRARLDGAAGAPTFRELLAQVRQVALNAYAHPDLPFEKLVEELDPERDLSRSPIVQVTFGLQNAPSEKPDWPELAVQPIEIDSPTSKFDLTLFMQETGQTLTGDLTYNTDLFDPDRIDRMVGHWQVLLEGIVAQPAQRVSDLPILTPVERRQLVDWTSTQADYPPAGCIHTLFEAQVERTPQAVAAVFSPDPSRPEDQCLTYQELNQRANQVAHYLRARGVGPDQLVGIFLERSFHMLVGILGVLKAGGAYAPIDPQNPPDRIRLMIQDLPLRTLITQKHLLPQWGDKETPTVCLDAEWDQIQSQAMDNPSVPVSAANLMYVMFTSGSTGQPKGIAVEHRQYWNYLHGFLRRLPGPAGQSFAIVSTFAADLGTPMVYGALCTGGQLHIIDYDQSLDPQAMAGYFSRHPVDVLKIVPSHFEAWQDLPDPAAVIPKQCLILAGEACPAELVNRVRTANPGCIVQNHYGPTETTVSVLAYPVQEPLERRLPLGKPLGNVRACVLDQALQPVPVGIPGELYIGGDSVARGYVNRPDLSAQQFIPDPWSQAPGARLYKTGDVVCWRPDGNLEFLGRADLQVKLRGHRIELGEIESVLLQHPAVREAVVTVRNDGPGDNRLVGYLVLHAGQALAAGEVHQFLENKLPDYMLPAAWVILDRLPLAPNGKVDRIALPAPRPRERGSEAGFAAPRTPLEEKLAGLWARVLGCKQVGTDDNFFALGGHSLLAVQVVSRIRQALHIELPLRTLFLAPTVAQLAEQICKAQESRPTQPDHSPALRPIPREGALALSFAQTRLWVLDQLQPGLPTYTIPLAFRLVGPLDIAALAGSLNEIIRRHESLRTTFAAVDGQPVQVIAPTLVLPLPVCDLSQLPASERQAQARRLAESQARQPFDLTQGPLLHARLLKLGSSEHLLVLTVHHIVSDAWSRDVFMRELGQLYQAFQAGRPSPLPQLPLQYADFAAWQREWLQGTELDKQLAYWKQQLAGCPPALELPTDRPRPAMPTHPGNTRSFRLPPALSESLEALGRQESATPFMTLLAAFLVLLHRYSGQTDIVVGSPIANRNRVEIETLIGFFVNTLVLRTRLDGVSENPSFRELLAQVRQVALDAYAHPDLPFEKLVEELQPVRDTSRSPLFQVMFVLQDARLGQLELRGLDLQPVELDTQTAKFDLTLFMETGRPGWEGVFEYNTDLFDPDRIARMIGHWQTLLKNLAANPDQRLSELPLLTDAERAQLLQAWSGAAAGDRPCDPCICQLFEAQAARTPNAVAVVCQDQRLTYQALDRRANQLAHYLRAMGVGPETLVGLCLERCPDMLVGIWGILKAGAAYVPLDPAYPQDRLAFMLKQTRLPVLLTQFDLADRLPPHPAHTIYLDADWEFIAQESPTAPLSRAAADNLAYVLYTSGSTGQPKGVAITRRGLANYLNWCLDQYALEDSLVHSSLSFDLTVTCLFTPLLAGCQVHLLPEEIQALATALQNSPNMLVKLTPTHLEWLAQQVSPQLTNARMLIIGGENLPAQTAHAWQRACPGAGLVNEYGPTETVVGCCVYSVPADFPASGSVPIGRPIFNTQLYVLDRSGQPVPAGVPGELYIGGAGLARGYWNRPDLTAEKFVPNPFPPSYPPPQAGGEKASSYPPPFAGGERLYRTGDRVRWRPDGNLEFLGRLDRQIKLRGHRIEPGEIEAVLSQHPAVSECAVLARDDLPGGLGLVAYLVAHTAPPPTRADLRAFMKKRLPEPMAPATFVFLDAMPLTPSGKVDHRRLPAPEPERSDPAGGPPRTPTEAGLAEIWASVLRLERVGGQPAVGVHDHFFELGGHSLLATQVVSRVRTVFQVELPLWALFQMPRLADLAEYLDTLLLAARMAAHRAEADADSTDEREEITL